MSAIRTSYHHEMLSMAQLSELTGVDDQTLTRWHRAGILSEAVIDHHIVMQSLRRRARALAASRGVPLDYVRIRESRGWGLWRAATERVER